MDIRVFQQMARPSWAKHFHELAAEIVPSGFGLITTHPDGCNQACIYLQFSPFKSGQRRQIVFLRVAVGCQAHHFELTVQSFESKVISQSGIEPTQ